MEYGGGAADAEPFAGAGAREAGPGTARRAVAERGMARVGRASGGMPGHGGVHRASGEAVGVAPDGEAEPGGRDVQRADADACTTAPLFAQERRSEGCAARWTRSTRSSGGTRVTARPVHQ